MTKKSNPPTPRLRRGKKVIVAMSGGVDSSVAAALLKRDGFNVVGVYMKCWIEGQACTSQDDERSARLAAAHLGIPFYTWNFLKEYREKVVDYMLKGYEKGITPNPDIMCNKEIKFGLFFEKAMKLGADYIATGHYARIRRCACSKIGGSSAPAADARLHSRRENSNLVRNQASRASEGFSHKHICSSVLLEGKDKNKDQSYFLSFIKPEVLPYVLFPVGEYTKSQVRELARKFGLPNAERKSSQGVCFIGKINFEEFLKQCIPAKRGAIIDTRGNVLGQHQGVFYYTIGQRKGIGLSGGPYYVVDKNLKENVLIVSREEKDLYRDKLTITDLNWFSHIEENQAVEVETKIRYRQTPSNAALVLDSSQKNATLLFSKPQRAVTPGQLAVLYQGDQMLAGGVIV